MPSGQDKSNRIAIVGASSLRGRELKTVLEERHFPASEIILLDEPVLAGTLTEAAGEPTFIRALVKKAFEGATFAFFAGSRADAEQNWQAARASGATVIDLTDALVASGESTSWIPALSTVLLPHPGARAREAAAPGRIENHERSIDRIFFAGLGGDHFAAQWLRPFQSFRRFAPWCCCSRRFPNATRPALMSSKPKRPACFPSAPSHRPFSMRRWPSTFWPVTAMSANQALSELRAGVARDVAEYLAGRANAPAIQLIQAPVFYGYAFTVYAEFRSPQPAEQLESR